MRLGPGALLVLALSAPGVVPDARATEPGRVGTSSAAAELGAGLEADPRVRRAPAPMAGRASTLLAEGGDWKAGTVGEQLDEDTTLVPYGKGALFVPAMTNPFDEPPVTVLVDGRRIEEGTTGSRIVLSPGTYEVRVGSGAVDQRMRFQATVEEGNTTIIPVSWSGLSVHVVDEAYGSLRTSYELIRVEDREYMGIGFGTDEQAGEPVTTWVLEPGVYKLVRLGDTYRARRDFATVRLVEGKHTHFLLVLNADNGTFAGGGEVPEEELFLAQQGFFGSLILGGDVSLNSRSGVPAFNDGLYFSFRAFLDARLSFELFEHPLVLRLQVEQGQTKGPGAPWLKSNDRVDLDGLYIYRLKRWIGPYVRLGAETNLLPGDTYFGDPYAVDIYGPGFELSQLDGPMPPQPIRSESSSSLRLSPSFGLTTIKEGLGINVRVFKSLFAETNVRTGFGARHRITRDLLGEVDTDEDAQTAIYRQVPTDNQIGIELTILAVLRLTRWVLINLEFDSLVPFDSLNNTVIELETSVALKLTSYISINYVLRFLRDRAIFQANQLENNVVLRFSLDLF